MSNSFINKIFGRTPRPRSKKRRANGTGTVASAVSNASSSVFTKVVNVEDGEDGQTGSRGPVMRGPQKWTDLGDDFEFQSGAEGEDFLDVVIFNGSYYVCAISHTRGTEEDGIISNIVPGSSTDEDGNPYWNEAQAFDIVATKILLATYAIIDNLGVKYLEIKGTDGYLSITDDDGNAMLEFKDGVLTCNTGTFNSITVNSATLTDCTIEGMLKTLFSETSQTSISISPGTNYSTPGGTTLALATDPDNIGKRIYICNSCYPPYSAAASSSDVTTINAGFMLDGSVAYMGFAGVMGTSYVANVGVKSISFRGGVLELLGVPYAYGDNTYCRWAVLSGHQCITSYETASSVI